MSTAWWLITSASAFGWAVTVIPLIRLLGARDVMSICQPPGAALTAQALVLWADGTTVTGACLSFAAGLAAMAVTARIQWRKK
jgi:hypothetical protein